MSPQPQDQIVFEGEQVFHHLLLGGPNGQVVPQTVASLDAVTRFVSRLSIAQWPLSFGLIPEGMTIRDIYQARGMFIFLVQIEPGPRTLRWLADDSPKQFGRGATYREVTLSLPYQYFFIALHDHGKVSDLNSVYFRNEAITSLDDPLCECAFFNCSPNTEGGHCWICTQGLSMGAGENESYAQVVNRFISWFFGSGFNASSEHHEGASFWEWTHTQVNDPRVQSIAAWEAASRKNDRFAVEVPWLPANRTPQDIYQELVRCGRDWSLTTSSLAAIVYQAAQVNKEGDQP